MKLTNDIKLVGIILAVIAIGFFMQKCSYDSQIDEKDKSIQALTGDTMRLFGRAANNASRADQLAAQLATKDKEKAQREKELADQLLSTQVDLQQIRAWAKTLSTTRKIGEIAKVLPKSMQADSARIQRLYTPADSALVDELYTKVQEGLAYKKKYETAQELAVSRKTTIDSLTSSNDAYKRGYGVIRQRLLTVYDERAFLNIGLGKQVLDVAKDVGRIIADPNVVSDLEKELNTTRR